MNRMQTPLGPVVFALALALVMGVSAAIPAAIAQEDPGNGTGGEFYVGRGGPENETDGDKGLPGNGGEADPDWFQIDSWSGFELDESDSYRAPQLPVAGPYGRLLDWLFEQASRAWFGVQR